jgi:hypothetical protein
MAIYLFLDIDGVLNTYPWADRGVLNLFDIDKIKLLVWFIKQAEKTFKHKVMIVVTSTRRGCDLCMLRLRSLLSDNGLNPVNLVTAPLVDAENEITRTNAIATYVEAIDAQLWIVFDDLPLFGGGRHPNFVQTNLYDGLNGSTVARGLKCLSAQIEIPGGSFV